MPSKIGVWNLEFKLVVIDVFKVPDSNVIQYDALELEGGSMIGNERRVVSMGW